MKYIYKPDTYDLELIKEKFGDENSFVKAQAIYRAGFEKILSKYIDFSRISQYILDSKVDIPIINDIDYNFYHKYSTLGSNYLFIRNNFHVENLSSNEIAKILFEEQLNIEFYNNTLERVIFEQGSETFFGIPVDSNIGSSKSIVFEFAFLQAKCRDLEHLKKIMGVIEFVFGYIRSNIDAKFTIPVTTIIYNALPDAYYNNN